MGPNQCTEYIIRFYNVVFGMDTSRWSGNAEDWYENGPSWELKAYPNGGTVAPQPDDIIVWGGGEFGHVAIITAVRDNAVDVIEQNSDPNTAYRTVTKSGNTFPPEGNYYVKGWLRK
jgi:surface antigen